MKRLTLCVAAVSLAAIAASLLVAAPQGPRKSTVTICHYSDLHDQYNTLELGQAAAQQHLDEHVADEPGPCRQ